MEGMGTRRYSVWADSVLFCQEYRRDFGGPHLRRGRRPGHSLPRPHCQTLRTYAAYTPHDTVTQGCPMSGEETPVSCAKCSAVWQKSSTTNCSGAVTPTPPLPGPATARLKHSEKRWRRPLTRTAATAKTPALLSRLPGLRGSATASNRGVTSSRPAGPG